MLTQAQDKMLRELAVAPRGRMTTRKVRTGYALFWEGAATVKRELLCKNGKCFTVELTLRITKKGRRLARA